MRIMSGLSSQSTPLRIGRLSSVDTANDVCEISFWRSPDRIRQLSLKRTFGNAGNSSRGKSEDLEVRAAAIERDALLAGGGDANRRRRKLARDLAELLRRDRDRARRLDVGRDFGRDGDVEIGARQANALVGRLDQDVREHRQRRLRRNARGDRGKTFLQLFPGDRKPHHGSSGVQNNAAILVLF